MHPRITRGLIGVFILLISVVVLPVRSALASSYTVDKFVSVFGGARAFALIGDTVWVFQGGLGNWPPFHAYLYNLDGSPKLTPPVVVPAGFIAAAFVNNHIYAVAGLDTLYVLNPDGTQIAGSPFDFSDQSVGQLSSIAVVNNHLWVGAQSRILLLNFDGSVANESPVVSDGLALVTGLGLVQGDIWAVDSRNILHIFKEDGSLAQAPITGNGLNRPGSIKVVGSEVWIANGIYDKGTVSRFAFDGTPSHQPITLDPLGVPPPTVVEDIAIINNKVWLSNNSYGFTVMDIGGNSPTPTRPTPSITTPLTIGWYTGAGIGDMTRLDRQKAQGESVQLAYYFDNPSYYLKSLEQAHLKVFLGLEEKAAGTGDVTALIKYINRYKDSPAIAGWVLYDEPEFNDIAPDTLYKEYQAIKKADPEHPVALIFGDGYCSYVAELDGRYFTAADIFLFDSYPIADQEEFDPTSDGKHHIDHFLYIMQNCLGYIHGIPGNKQFMMIAQGFNWGGTGSSGKPNRNPTYGEERYFTFLALTQPIAGLLYWIDYRADPTMTSTVHRVMSEASALGSAIQNGITNDPSIEASSDAIMYRYGTDGSNNYLIAVNRSDATITTQFTLPAAIKTQTAVLMYDGYDSATQQYRARTIPLSPGVNGRPMFSDTFTRYQVHIYQIAESSASK